MAMQSACSNSIFQGLQTPNSGPKISHMFYADDAMFMGEWSKLNFNNLARILRCFHVVSGLRVNFHKSKVFGIGVSGTKIDNYARILGCEKGSLPFLYLGVPVGANMSLKRNWLPIIEKTKSKLSAWKEKTLSFGGRLTLIQSVLDNKHVQ